MKKIFIIYIILSSIFTYSQKKETTNETIKYLTLSEIKHSKIVKETYMLMNKIIVVKDGFNIDANVKVEFMCKVERLNEKEISKINLLIDDALSRAKKINSLRDYSFQPKEINLSNINSENMWIANVKYSIQNENNEIIDEFAFLKWDKEFNQIKSIYEEN